MNTTEISLSLNTGGTSQKLAISSTSAQSAAAATNATIGETKGEAIPYVICPDTDCFIRKGTNPTALSDGTDGPLLKANQQYRVELMDGEKMAFITTSASGFVYITPRA